MYVGTMPKGEAEGILVFVVPGKLLGSFKWHVSQCRTSGAATHTGPGAGMLLVAYDGQRLSCPGKRLPAVSCLGWGNIQGASMPYSGPRTVGACPHGFHKCGIQHGAQQASLCQECPRHHKSLHPLCSGHGNQGSDHQDHRKNAL